MSFLASVNGGSTGTGGSTPSGSSRFLGGIKTLDEKGLKRQQLAREAEAAKKESERANSPMTIAKETVLGIPKVLQNVAKVVVDDPMKTLATPVIRTEQAIAAAAGRAIGGDFGGRLERAANQPMTLPSAFGGDGGTIEPQRGFDDGGAKQIVGDTAKYAATVYTGGRVAPVVGTARSGLIKAAGIQGAKEGAIATGGYMGGDELQRRESTAESVIKETGKGLALGGFLGGVLGGGGAALAKPAAEAARLRPLPVEDGNASVQTLYRGGSDGSSYSSNRNIAESFAENRGGDVREYGLSPNARVADYSEFPEKKYGLLNEDSIDSMPNKLEFMEGPLEQDYARAAQWAQENGYDAIKFPTEGEVRVLTPGIVDRRTPNIRRIKNLPVQDDNILPGRTRANARQVPINRVDEGYIPEADLPSIQVGPRAKSELPEIQFARPKSRASGDITYEPIRTASTVETARPAVPTTPTPKVPKPIRGEVSAARSRNTQPAPGTPARADITPSPTRPVTMDVPKRTASVEVNKPRPGQATTISKAASDANRKLAEDGFDAIPEEELAKIGSINKADQLDRVARLMDDPNVKDMAAGTKPIPDGVAPQVLFNAVKNRAIKEGDFETLQRLARSKIAEERATAAQTLGSAGYNNEPADALEAIRDIEKTRSGAAERRRQPSDIKKEAKTAETSIKKARAKQTWDQVVDSLTC